jgi:hypothetical protein
MAEERGKKKSNLYDSNLWKLIDKKNEKKNTDDEWIL